MKRLLFSLIALSLVSGAALADDPKIVAVKAVHSGMGWRIDVTLSHPDSGWDHYADGWEVLDAAGNRLGMRKLMHPHVDEQPFTRALHSVMVPDGTREVFIRARCSVSGWAGDMVPLRLEQ
ncbi:MAG: hypothetical protein R3256_00410 [Thalassovita sp.]|nr:hypothetical protein [Thalassovita sp.]